MKQCAKCKEIKDDTEFRPKKHRSGRSTLQSYCKDCSREFTRKSMERFRKEHPDLVKMGKRKYYLAHQKDIDAKNKEWKDAHPEQTKEYHRISAKRLRGYHNAYYHKYESKKRGNGGEYTEQEWIALCSKYGNKCLCCHKEKPLTVDHVIPVSLGGSSDISNIQPLCKSCNSRKHDKIIDYRPTAPTC